MDKVISKDGTPIAFDTTGTGPALILVDGAMCSRSFGPMPALAKELARRFTVFHYDRRGRGDSGNGSAYDVQREIEDLDAVIQKAGGSAMVFGMSSGAALAAEAARRLRGIRGLALYEAPYAVDDTHEPLPSTFIVYRTLAGQTHMVKRDVLVPALIEFFDLASATDPAKELAFQR